MSDENREFEQLRFPIGKFEWDGAWNDEIKIRWIQGIAAQPAALRTVLAELGEDRLDTSYRPGGWTVRQVVHHMADSHINSFIRFKLALTEEQPVIKPYEETLWANLADSLNYPLDSSLALLDALHIRWTDLLLALSEDDYQRAFYHPGSQRLVSLREALGLYYWHGNHHIAHINSLLP